MRTKIFVVAALSALAAGCGGGGAETPASPPSAGADVFASAGCANCHTLKAAGASGRVGPSLDLIKPSAAMVEQKVLSGGGGMPSFKAALSAEQIKALADYVSKSAGGS